APLYSCANRLYNQVEQQYVGMSRKPARRRLGLLRGLDQLDVLFQELVYQRVQRRPLRPSVGSQPRQMLGTGDRSSFTRTSVPSADAPKVTQRSSSPPWSLSPIVAASGSRKTVVASSNVTRAWPCLTLLSLDPSRNRS